MQTPQIQTSPEIQAPQKFSGYVRQMRYTVSNL